MGKLNACFVVAVGAFAAACGDDGGSATKMDAAVPDAKVWMDAMIDAPPMFDLTCNGNNAPTTAAANITLSGFAQSGDFNLGTGMFELTPIVDATVKACDTVACNGQADGSDATDNAGDWSIDAIATGGVPLDDYLQMTKTGVRTTLVYPHAPFTADQAGIPFLTFGPLIGGVLGSLDGCDNAANPLIIVAVTDCANEPISDTANLAITVRQAGSPVATAKVHDLSEQQGAPAQVAGLFLICGVPANDETELGAMYNGMTFLSHTVKAIADGTTSTQIRPGY